MLGCFDVTAVSPEAVGDIGRGRMEIQREQLIVCDSDEKTLLLLPRLPRVMRTMMNAGARGC
jgi:hypothetical protein